MRYLSFVIRLWHRDGETHVAEGLNGRIEHVQSNAETSISHLADITAFVKHHLEVPPLAVNQNKPQE